MLGNPGRCSLPRNLFFRIVVHVSEKFKGKLMVWPTSTPISETNQFPLLVVKKGNKS